MKIIEEVVGLVSSKLDVLKTMISIIKLETRLAGLSVYPLLLNILMLLIVVMALWLLILLLLGYFVVLVSNNVIMAMMLTILFNVAVCLGLLKYLAFNLKKMSFEKTREFILSKEIDQNEKSKNTTSKKNCDDGKKIKMPTN